MMAACARALCLLLTCTLALTGCNDTADATAALDEMVLEVAAEFPELPVITTADLAVWLADPGRQRPQLLDIREPREYAVSHLPGAINVPPATPPEELGERIDLTRPIVVYCSVGFRSSHYGQRLLSAGATQVRNLEGSIFRWANEARPLMRGAQKTRQVHPFNERYGRLLKRELRSYH